MIKLEHIFLKNNGSDPTPKKEIGELSEEKRKKKSQIEKTEALRISAIIDALVAQIEVKMQEGDTKKDVEKDEDD